MKKLLLFSVCLGFAVLSCKNQIDEAIQPQTVNIGRDIVNTSLNQTMQDIAWTMSRAMVSSSDFRNVVKTLALEKFDGDYDILLKHLKNKRISDFQSTRGELDVTVATMFDELFPVSAKSSTQENVLEMLAQMYPTMQISVPVNVDKWEDGYIPTVVFVDENFEDTVTEYVMGYNALGEVVWVDAIKEPDVPVVVVGWNERIGLMDDSMVSRTGDVVSASNLTAVFEGLNIKLNWQYNNGTPMRTMVFVSVNGGVFRGIGDTVGTSYSYGIVSPNTEYSFYLKVLSPDGQTVANTDVVTITSGNAYVDEPSSFSATPINNTQVLLSWSLPNTSTYDCVSIYRKELANSSSVGLGSLIASVTNMNTRQFIDSSAKNGKKYLYTVFNSKNGCVSNYKYDTIWKPYRNCSQADSVYIKSISYDSANYRDDIESWIYGAPEFRVSVHTVPGETTTPSTRVNGKFFYFDDRDQSCKIFNSGNYLFSWLPVTTYDCMTIYMSEWDRETASESLSLSVGVGFKVPAGDDIVPVDATITVTINADDIPIGLGHTYYYEQPVQTMTLENFDFAVTISDTNVNNNQ